MVRWNTLQSLLFVAIPTILSVSRVYLQVTSLIPIAAPKPLPFGIPATWSHMATTLIHGHKNAVLVDPPLTVQQGEKLVA